MFKYGQTYFEISKNVLALHSLVKLLLQLKPLNVITLDQTESDNSNRMITITGDFYLVIFSKWDFEM